MTSAVNDIVKQAKQGSVAAIIQVLNEKLADSGVRTRAIFADGVLQLLCEAATAEQLEQSVLADRIQRILESISPRNIRRVNINSRIVREQQLLWLEEINRDPENQILWSQEITLAKPSVFQQALSEWRAPKLEAKSTLTTRSPRQLREQRQFMRGGMLGGISVALLLLAGWGVFSWISTQQASNTQIATSPTPAPSAAAPSAVASTKPVSQSDPFANAVRIAEKTAIDGQQASSSAEWLSLAARWREASELMAKVPDSDGRYQTAQQKAIEYREKSESLLQKAQQ